MPGGDLIPYDQAKLVDDEAEVQRGFWQKLRQVIGKIPFAEDLLAAYYCAIDRTTPTYVRAVLLGALAYFILPADVVPDFMVLVGFTDDAAVLAAALGAVRSHVKPEHRARAREALAGGLPEPEQAS